MDAAPKSLPGEIPPSAAAPFSPTRTIRLVGLTLCLCYLIVLGGTFLKGDFLLDAQGRPIANDFVNVAAAGRVALDGEPAAAYDWLLHKQVEVRVIGHDFANYYGWHYPPPFLFVAAALALLPYLSAALVWLGVTLCGFAATLGFVLRDRVGIVLALGFPAAVWNVTAGQNGFLTATLIGGALASMERRPALAGLFLGLLTYKPQFGLLFPLVLIADRRRPTFVVAAAVALGLAALSWLAFGSASWAAFLHWMPITGHVVLGEGAADWSRLQSLFGFMRAHGAGETLAWTVQAVGTLTLAAALVWLWRSRVAFELKAAALAAGTLLATPYVYMYDLVVLAVAVAFLLRVALRRGWSTIEIAGLAAAGILILIYPYVKAQVGLAAGLIVFALIARRALLRNGARKAMNAADQDPPCRAANRSASAAANAATTA